MLTASTSSNRNPFTFLLKEPAQPEGKQSLKGQVLTPQGHPSTTRDWGQWTNAPALCPSDRGLWQAFRSIVTGGAELWWPTGAPPK